MTPSGRTDPLADVESDKAVVTMPAPASGRITEFCVKEGERLKVGSLMLVMETAGNGGVPAAAPAHAQPPAPSPATPAVPAASVGGSTVQASPAVRKRARELDVSLDAVRPSKPGARITIEDLEAHAAGASTPAAAQTASAPAASRRVDAPPAASGAPTGDEIPFRGIRRRIAEAMETSARTVPHVTGFHEFDAEALVRLHAALKPPRRGPRRPLHLHAVHRPGGDGSTARAPDHQLDARRRGAGHPAEEDLQHRHRGRGAGRIDGAGAPSRDRLGLLDIARGIDRLVAGAREGRLQPADLQQGTFTITNVGGARGWLNTSLIRLPEVAILGVGRVEERAVVRGGQVVARPIMPLALTFDHRVIDGEEGLGFMLTLREWLEHPERLLVSGDHW